jgi:tetratricopeptide (TPR) repeat protein
MYHTKRKQYSGRWLVKLLEVALIFGIIFYSLDALGQFVAPEYDSSVIVIQPIQQEVVQIQGNAIQLDEEVYFNLALDHQISGEYYNAILDYTRVLELNDDIPEAWLNRGVAYEQMGNSRATADFAEYLNHEALTTISLIPVNSSVDFTQTMFEDYRYDIPIELNAGDVLSISVTSSVAGQVDPIMVLVDANGNPVIGTDDMREQDGSLISMNAYLNNYDIDVKGEYTLLISHAGGGADGDIDIRISIDK